MTQDRRLHVYRVEQWDGEEHWIVAESLEAATAIVRAWPDEESEVQELPDDYKLPICDCDAPGQPIETKTCAEWVADSRPGDLLASTVVS